MTAYLQYRIVPTLILGALLAACGSSVPLVEPPSVPVTETKTVSTQIKEALGIPAPPPSLITGDFYCELGNRVGLVTDTDGNVVMIWKGRSYPLAAVTTTTGAVRYENKDSGLVWIQIPSKSILLNAKQGQQLANECKLR